MGEDGATNTLRLCFRLDGLPHAESIELGGGGEVLGLLVAGVRNT